MIIASKWLWRHLETPFVVTKATNVRLISPSIPTGNFRCSLLSACCRMFYSVCRKRKWQQFFLPWRSSLSGPGPPHYRGFKITLRHTPFDRTPLGEWSARRRNLYLTTHITHKRHPCPCGIRNRNRSKWTAADPSLRPRSHRDRPTSSKSVYMYCVHLHTAKFSVSKI